MAEVKVRAPSEVGGYEIDWLVANGSLVRGGTPLAWLSPAGHCTNFPLLAPCDGVVARRSSLLPIAGPGALLAVVAGDAAELRTEERKLLLQRRGIFAAELEAVRGRGVREGAATRLLADEERRLTEWMKAADQALASPSPADGADEKNSTQA